MDIKKELKILCMAKYFLAKSIFHKYAKIMFDK